MQFRNSAIAKRTSWLIATSILVPVLGVAMAASPASAAPTCPASGGHCYMLANFGPLPSPTGFHGWEDKLYAQCLSVSNPSANFDDVETWMSVSGGSNWIEAGINYGNPEGASENFFWADVRPGYGYYQHMDTTDTVNPANLYTFNIYQASTTSYHLTVGPWNGLSSPWPTNQRFALLQAGSETTNGATAASIFVRTRDLSYYDVSNTLHSGWTNGVYATGTSSTPSTWGSITTLTANSFYQYDTVSSC